MLPIYSCQRGTPAMPGFVHAYTSFEFDMIVYVRRELAWIIKPIFWCWINRDFFRVLGVRAGFLWLDDFGGWASGRFGWRFWANPRSYWQLRKIKSRYGRLFPIQHL